MRLMTAGELLAQVEKSADHPGDRYAERVTGGSPELLSAARSAAKDVARDVPSDRAHAALRENGELVGYAAYKFVGKRRKPVLATVLPPTRAPSNSMYLGDIMHKAPAKTAAEVIAKKVKFQGIPVHIDRPKGYVQSGTSADGTPEEKTQVRAAVASRYPGLAERSESIQKEAANRITKIMDQARKLAPASITGTLAPGKQRVLDQAEALMLHPATSAYAEASLHRPKSLFDLHLDGAKPVVGNLPELMAEARNPTTSAPRLAELAGMRHQPLMEAAAVNPAAGAGMEYLHQIRPDLADANPTTDLLRLVNGGSLPKMDPAAFAEIKNQTRRGAELPWTVGNEDGSAVRRLKDAKTHLRFSGNIDQLPSRWKGRALENMRLHPLSGGWASDSTHPSILEQMSEKLYGKKEAATKTQIFAGLRVRIDRPKGYVQKGKDTEGKPWKRTYSYDYGFVPKTEGGDDEELDVFLGPNPKADTAFWVTQRKDDGSFDEYKVFLGFRSQADAKKAYLAHIPRKYYGGMEEMPVAAMRTLLGQQPFTKSASYRHLVSVMSKHADALTDAARQKIKEKNFAVPSEKKYPIHDPSHARAALSLVSAHGTPVEKAQVAAAVTKKYPVLAARSSVVQRVADSAPVTSQKEAAIRVLSMLKIAAPRWTREVSKAMGHGDVAAARAISSRMGQAAPRLVQPLSMGGQEAAVALMAGKPIQGEAAHGLFARKMYKPDSFISSHKGTTDLLAKKQDVVDTARALSPEARELVPNMHGFKELGQGDKLRHISDHEYVHGLRRTSLPERLPSTKAVQDHVVRPLDMKGMPVGDVPVLTNHGKDVGGNLSNVMVESSTGKPKMMDFLPTGDSSPVKMDASRTGVLSLGGSYTKYDGSKGYGFNDLAREVHRPSVAHAPVPVLPQKNNWGKAIELPPEMLAPANAPPSGTYTATPQATARSTPALRTPMYSATPRVIG